MSGDARKTAEGLEYLSGFGNEHASEAVPGALPHGRNSPQRAPLGRGIDRGLHLAAVAHVGR